MSPKKKKDSHRYINDMISETDGRKKEILLRLRELNKEAYLILHSLYFNMKRKYRVLQKQSCWQESKKLLIEYFTYDNILKCSICSKVIDSRRCIIHHNFYKVDEIFSPIFIDIIHSKCHENVHDIVNVKK